MASIRMLPYWQGSGEAGSMSVRIDCGLASKTFLHGGAYRIGRVLACSELSIVYAARETGTGEACVVKEFFPKSLALRDVDGRSVLCRTPSLRSKYETLKSVFLNEAVILGRLRHPNIVRLTGHVEENGTAYIILERCRGVSLERCIRKNRLRSKNRFYATTVPSLLDALEYIHEQGVLHRDIKPSNIIVGPDGQAKLLDFGSAVHSLSEDKPIFTSAGYSPLEFYSAASRQGPFSDLYSTGATLYYCLCGEAPVEAGRRLFHDPVEQVLRKRGGRVTPLLSRRIINCLSMDAGQRGSVRRLRTALKAESLLWKAVEGLRANFRPGRNSPPGDAAASGKKKDLVKSDV